MSMVQPVNVDYLYNSNITKAFNMIDNYVYLYHTDTLIAIPTYPESIADSMPVGYSQTAILSRSAPMFAYSNSGPRNLSISLQFHRDMMNAVNTGVSNLKIDNLSDDDYVDQLVKQLQASVLPRYAASEKMVNPPLVAVRFGNDIFCKGVITGGINTNLSGPILRGDNYALIQIDFTLNEVDPYDADIVQSAGLFRGLSTDLQRRVWKTHTSSSTTSTIK